MVKTMDNSQTVDSYRINIGYIDSV